MSRFSNWIKKQRSKMKKYQSCLGYFNGIEAQWQSRRNADWRAWVRIPPSLLGGIKKQNGFWKKTNFPLTLRWGVEQIRYNWSTRPRPSPPLPPSARSPRPSSSCAGSSAPSGAPPPRSARCRLRQTSCKANQGSSVDDRGSCSRWKEPVSLIHDPDVLESNNRGRANVHSPSERWIS